MPLSQLEKYRKNKAQVEVAPSSQDGFDDVEPVEGTVFAEQPENLPPEKQIEQYTVRRKERVDAEAERVASALPLLGDPAENIENEGIAVEYQKVVNPEVKATPGVVAAQKDRMAAAIAKHHTAATLKSSPRLRRWLTNPENARIASSDLSALSQLEHGIKALGRAVGRGAIRMGGQVPNQIASDVMGEAADQHGKTFIERYTEARGENAGYIFGKPLTPEEIVKHTKPDGSFDYEMLADRGEDPIGAFIDAYKGTAIDQANTLIGNDKQDREAKAAGYQKTAAQYEKKAAGLEMSEAGKRAQKVFHNNGKPLAFKEALSATLNLAKGDPGALFALIGEVGTESITMMGPALGLAAATRSPRVGALALGGTSYAMERNLEPIKFFQKKGYDLTKDEDVQRLRQNKELIAEAQERGHLRGAIIGALDLVSGGIAGKALAQSPAGNMAVQMLSQGMLGGTGEALAQQATDGKINYGEVVIEALAEFATGPIEVAGLAARKFKEDTDKATKAEQLEEGFKQLSTAAQQSELRSLSPELFQKFMDENLKGSEAENIFIPVDSFFEYLDKQKLSREQIVELLPSLDEQELQRALVTGEDIVIPTTEYLSRVAGSEMDVFVQEHAKFNPEDMSTAEARIFRNDEILEQARVAARQQAEEVTRTRNDEVLTKMQNELQEQLEGLGRTKQAATQEALLMRSFYEGFAERANMSATDVVKKYRGVKVVNGEAENESPLEQKAAVKDLASAGLYLARDGDLHYYIRDEKTGDEIGRVFVKEDLKTVEKVDVKKDYRGRGVANAAYNEIETVTGVELQPSDKLSEDGTRLWERRRAKVLRQDDIEKKFNDAPPATPRTDAELLNVKPEALHMLTFSELKRMMDLLADPKVKKAKQKFMDNVQKDTGARVFEQDLKDGTVVQVEIKKGNGISKFDITATVGGEQVAEAIVEYNPSTTMGQVTRITVDEAYQRKGVGTAIYDSIDMHLKELGGGRVEPSDTHRTDAANAFWARRLQGQTELNQLPGMHSSTITAIEKLKMKKGAGEQMWNTVKKLPGVKKSELEWMGLEAFLKSKKTVTKDEVLDYMNAHKIEMHENTYATPPFDPTHTSIEDASPEDLDVGERAQEQWEDENYNGFRDAILPEFTDEEGVINEEGLEEAIRDDMREASYEVYYDAALGAMERRMMQDSYEGPSDGPVKFPDYTQDGGTEYREIAFSMDIPDERGYFNGAHFGPANTFAHTRVKTREHNGKRVLHVEEIQSDMDAEGRKSGFNTALSDEEFNALNDEYTRLDAIVEQANEVLHTDANEVMQEYYAVKDRKYPESAGDPDERKVNAFRDLKKLYTAHISAIEPFHTEDNFYAPLNEEGEAIGTPLLKEVDRLRALTREIDKETETERLRMAEIRGRLENTTGVPDFPFKNNKWQDLVVKRVLGMAVEEGYDAVSFNRGFDIASVSAGQHFKMAAGNPVDIKRLDEDKFAVQGKYVTNREGLVEMFGEEFTARRLASLNSFIPEADLPIDRDVEWANAGFVRAYDKQLPQFLKKYLKQWDVELQNEPVVNTTNGNPYVEINDKMRESIKETGQLFQGPRGNITLPTDMDGEAIVKLFKGADLSTFLHESGHYFLGVLDHAARQPDATPEINGMMSTVRNWWRNNAEAVAKDGGNGLTADDVVKYLDEGTTGDLDKDTGFYVGAHEQWARAFESYLMDGKAPKGELQEAFEQFRIWLAQVYEKFVHGLDVEVTADIRSVFNKMLATDAQIAEAKEDSTVKMVASSPEDLGVSPEDFATLQDLFNKTQAEATASALEAGMAEVRKAQDKANKKVRKSIRAEVEAEVNARPVYRAIEWLGNKRWLGDEDGVKPPVGMRLNKQEIIERFGKSTLRKLPRGSFRMYAADGMGLDEAAGWFGFENADRFIEALETVPRRVDSIDIQTDMRMDDAVREQLTDEQIETDVKAAYEATENKGKFIAAELRILNRSIGDMRTAKVLTANYARQIARNTINGMRTRDATALNKFLATERREANKAQEAFKRGDKREAAGHKYRQLFNHMLYTEGKKVQAEVGKIERLAKRLEKKGTRKNLAPDYLDAIDELLGQYDFRKLGVGEEQRREKLKAYIDMMTEAGRENELAIPDHVLENAEREPYMTLTVDRLRGVYAALKNIESSARRKKKLLDAKRERDMDQVVNDLTDAFVENLKPNPPGRVEQRGDRTKRGLKQFLNLTLTADTQTREIDGFKDAGPAYTNIKRGIDEATARLEVRRKEAAKSFEELYAVYTRKERNEMSVAKHDDNLRGSFSKWDKIAIALNTGNKDNLQRLTDMKVKGSFTPYQVEQVLASLDKRDMDFVQSVWDFIDGYYQEIAAREKRVTGVTPTKVQAQPVQTPHGEYKGGYYPLKYDPRLSNLVREETNEDFMNNARRGRFGKAQTRNGHTKERAQSSGRPIMLDIGVVHGHVNNVLHDLELSEEVTNTWRLLQDARVKDLFLEYGKQPEHEALELWVQDVATGQQAAQDSISRTARYMKSGFTVSKLAFNISTVLVQVTGLGQSAVVLGKKNLAKGMLSYAKDRGAAINDIMARSDFMKERSNTFNKDIHDIMGDVKVGPKEGPYKRFMQETMAPAAFYLMTRTQFLVVDVPTWLGAYEQGVNDNGMTEAEAIQHADRTVARAQASGIFADRSPIERGTISPNTRQNDVVRMFTTLGSYMFAKANVAYERTGKTDFADPKEILSYAFDMTLLFTFEAVLYHALKGTLPGGEEDDDKNKAAEWAKFLASETLFSVMGTMPFIRDAASPLKGFDAGGAYGSIMETLTKPFAQAADGEIDKAFVKSLVDSGGMLLHLPSAQLNRAIDASWRASEGEEVSPMEYLMGKKK